MGGYVDLPQRYVVCILPIVFAKFLVGDLYKNLSVLTASHMD